MQQSLGLNSYINSLKYASSFFSSEFMQGHLYDTLKSFSWESYSTVSIYGVTNWQNLHDIKISELKLKCW